MHEMALASGVIDVIESARAQQAFTRVRRVVLEIGALSHVDPHALEFGFEATAKGTVAEGAALEIRTPAGTARCFDCESEVAIERRGDPCPNCGSHRLFVITGEDMTVKELEVD